MKKTGFPVFFHKEIRNIQIMKYNKDKDVIM